MSPPPHHGMCVHIEMLQRIMAFTVMGKLLKALVGCILVLSMAVFWALVRSLAACATDTIHMSMVSSAVSELRDGAPG